MEGPQLSSTFKDKGSLFKGNERLLRCLLLLFLYEQVRLSALYVMQELYLKMGEEFVTLLPETIPFLAELMEGESVDCLFSCKK